MRFKINLIPNFFEISLNYRKIFISFLKRVFSFTDFYENYYLEKRLKPFTFSVWFGDKFEIRNDKICFSSNKMSFYFSTGDSGVFANFYNGVLKLKKEKEKFNYQGFEFLVDQIELLPYRKIKSSQVIFKTLGISILTDPDQSAKDFEAWFITPLDDLERFNKVLQKRTIDKIRSVLGVNLDVSSLRLEPLDEESIKVEMVKHYKGYLKGFRGYFYLRGDPKVLQFLYDYGLGVRCGQGFGMLEIVKEA